MTEEEILIVCPNEEKEKILEDLNTKKGLHNIKFMTKEEYKKNYYFDYDEEALFYLLNKHHYNLDVAKIYLKNLYPIDETKTYQSPRLNFLKNLKIELKEHNLLKENPLFKLYLKTKKIIVKNYYDLDKYEEEMFNQKVQLPDKILNKEVTECETLEDEVNYVCLEILKLLNKGININKIILTNVSNDYYYTIKKLFNYYKIPINLKTNTKIFSSKIVKDYLETNKLDLEDKNKQTINKQIISIVSSLSKLDDTTIEYKNILIDKLKNATLKSPLKKDAVAIKDLYNETFKNDEYVFVLGFNQDILPKTEKDISYISDNLKEELPMYKTSYLNKRNKETLVRILGSIDNLYLSYKLSSPFASYYKSSLITELNLPIKTNYEDNYTYSNIYNKIRLAELLDLYYLYGELPDDLLKLNNSYNIPYKTYDNKFTGINHNTYLNNIKNPLLLSYTSINSYNECAFKYYIKNVLKLDKYEDTFAAFVGSLFHKILELCYQENFDLDKEFNEYLNRRELTIKEKILLIRIKEELKNLLEEIKHQQLITGYNNSLYEKRIDIPLTDDNKIIFTGSIDKIMYCNKVQTTYFSIVDYKTGNIDTHIEPMKYGLHMQLPVYLYLISKSHIFENQTFTGIYYQNIMFPYFSYSTKKTPQELYKENLKLQGYSIEDPSILAVFDSTYEKSDYIKSMSYTEEKGFGTYAKTITYETLDDLISYTEEEINKAKDNIISANFNINPKVYSGTNIACTFCKFKDICYMKEQDQKYLDKVEDLSFLGGEE